MDAQRKIIEMDIADVLMERPRGFRVGKQPFYLYPVTLGKSILLSRVIENLGINVNVARVNPYIEAIRLCKSKKEEVCRLLAYHTLDKREELFDEERVKERCRSFASLSDEEMAELLVLVLKPEDIEPYTRHLGIDKERRELARIAKIKEKDNSSLNFGGKSVFGSLILPACEKLNMTPRQVVWEIGYSFLQMLLADATTSVYLTEKELKSVHIRRKGTFINADDPKNLAMIKSMKWD